MAVKNILIIAPSDTDYISLRNLLQEKGFHVESADSGESGLSRAEEASWNFIVLDYTLPGMDGFDVCRELKRNRRTRHIPLIIVSHRGDEADVIAALELGADDFVTKPFSARVLVSKIRCLLRQVPRRSTAAAESIEIHGIAIHPGRHEVRIGDRMIDLTVTEFELLHFLARNPGKAFRRNEILRELRGREHIASERAVDVQVAGLRRRLGSYGNRIETVRGIGYRLRVH